MPVWAGVDVGGRTKGFHVAILDEQLSVTVDRSTSIDASVAMLLGHGPRVVAIDSPSAWAPEGERSRPCERIFARTGLCRIRFTPDAPTARARADRFYEWIEVGLDLWSGCRSAGLTAIECFPTATWSAWIGPRAGRTRAAWTKIGVAELARRGVRGLEAVGNQDERDAMSAALTAWQWDRHRATVDDFDGLVVPQPGTLPPVIASNRHEQS